MLLATNWLASEMVYYTCENGFLSKCLLCLDWSQMITKSLNRLAAIPTQNIQHKQKKTFYDLTIQYKCSQHIDIKCTCTTIIEH